MSAATIVLIYVAIFIFTAVFLRIPVGFSMGITALCMFSILGIPIAHYSKGINATLDNFPFLAVPFFVLAGALMQYSGISKSLVKMIDAVAGRVRASLSIVTVLASLAFGVLTGSNMATLSTIGGLMIPEMVKKGYKRSFCGALVASCSYLGTFIPPSVPGIMFALAAGQKVSEVWLSTIIPGLMFGGGYVIWCVISQWNTEDKSDIKPFVAGPYFKNIGKQFITSIPALIMPAIIFGGIYGGIFTPTEAGSISCAYGIFYFVVQKYVRRQKLDKSLWRITIDSMASTAMICCLMAFARSAGYTFTLSSVANDLATYLTTHIQSKVMFMIILNVILLIEGTFVDLNSGILIMTPLLMPTIVKFGIDPIHFGAILLCNLSIGTVTPPMAGCLYFGSTLAKSNIVETIKEVMPFVYIGIACVAILSAFPNVALAIVHALR
ncbi:MAG TPA: TRAP transporter large permease [Bacillota bacterium]|nr:TRAP transporter large permease [Bacillota bacterium]